MLNATGTLKNGSAIIEAMKEISFEGIENGTVKIDSNGDAIVPLSVMNYVAKLTPAPTSTTDDMMQGVEVGTFTSGELVLNVSRIVWPSSTTALPKDLGGPATFVPLFLFPIPHDSHRARTSRHMLLMLSSCRGSSRTVPLLKCYKRAKTRRASNPRRRDL